jgi:hypothetical protein
MMQKKNRLQLHPIQAQKLPRVLMGAYFQLLELNILCPNHRLRVNTVEAADGWPPVLPKLPFAPQETADCRFCV